MNRTTLLGIAILVCACAGEDGKDGAPGADGRDGADGEQGPPGEQGERGPAGPAGPAGENGEDGSDAEATEITESIFCAGGLEGTTGLGFQYNAVLFSSGDLFVSGAIMSLVGQASVTRFFAPEQNGFATAQVEVFYDVDATADGGWFTLALDRKTLVTSIGYRETGSTREPDATWSMPASACVYNQYRR